MPPAIAMTKVKRFPGFIGPLTASGRKFPRIKKVERKADKNTQKTSRETQVQNQHVPFKVQDKILETMAHDRDVAMRFREDQDLALKSQEQFSERSAQDEHAALSVHGQVSQAKPQENSTQTSLQKEAAQETPEKQPERIVPHEQIVQTLDRDHIIRDSLEKQQVHVILNAQHLHSVPKEQSVQTSQKERPVQMARKKRQAQATLQKQPMQAPPKERSVQVDPKEERVQAISNKQPIQASIEKQSVQASLQEQLVQATSTEKAVQVTLRKGPVQMTRTERRAQGTPQTQPVQANPKGRLVSAISKELPVQTIRGKQHVQGIRKVQSTTKERLAQVIPEVESVQTATRDRPLTIKSWRDPLQMSPQDPDVQGPPIAQPIPTATSHPSWTLKLWQHWFQKASQEQPMTNNAREDTSQHNHRGQPVNIIRQLNTREQPKNAKERDLAKMIRKSINFNKDTSKSPLSEFLRQINAFFDIRVFHFLTWLRGETCEHFGPACRIPDLFLRRDQTFLDLSAERLRWFLPPPPTFHDIFAVAKKVHRIEETIGYEFKNKMLIVEALKMSGTTYPLYFNGTVHPVENNNRLALLGDRVLSLSLTETWFHGGSSTKEYTSMNLDTITRASLAARGRKIGLDASILIVGSLPSASLNHVAETFEAILGAVYVDAGNRLGSVTNIIRLLEMDNHFRKEAGGAPKITVASKLRSPTESIRNI